MPDPWRPTDADGLAWAFPAGADAQAAGADPDHVGAIAPYPTLVHVGSDAASSWLLNLEHTGGLVLTGDPDRCLNLARVMAAQLVLNPWAEAISVTMLGFGQQLVDAAPGRLRYAAAADAEAVLAEAATGAVRTADFADHHQVTVLDARRRAVADETWAPHVLLVDAGCLAGAAGGTGGSPPALSRLLDSVHTRAAATGRAPNPSDDLPFIRLARNTANTTCIVSAHPASGETGCEQASRKSYACVTHVSN